jgi:uncharacterized protein YegL
MPLSLLAADEVPRLAIRVLPTASSASARRAFHLGLLLDVSGSMDGDRIAALKTTIRLLIDALIDGDRLTIIKYESAASVVAEAEIISAVTRVTLRDRLDAMRADGGTNLEAAVSALRTVTETTAQQAPIDAVFILTDGQINQGLTSAAGLIRLLTAAVPAGTPAHTLGFGAEVNSRMLRDMSMRTRGSYTYADANEVLPAVIADITAGLATEVGRNAVLTIPDGWKCAELSAEDGTTTYNCGTLVADKPLWIVLTGPVGCTSVPAINLTYTTGGGAGVQTTTLAADAVTLESYHAQEQYCRCRVAAVQSQVQEHLESGRVAEAKTALTDLGTELDANPEKDRTFIISMRAQVDEMLEALASVPAYYAVRAGARAGWGGAIPAGGAGLPTMAPIISRMASNTAALANQNGFVSALRSTGPALRGTSAGGAAARAGLSGVSHTFSSPAQQETTVVMTQRYAHVSVDGAAALNEEEAAAFVEAVRATMSTASAPATPAAAAEPATP